MTSLDAILDLLRTAVPSLDTEPVALAEAGGRTLREPVVAAEDQPPFARSAVDGFAIGADDPASEFHVVDFLRAGDWRPRALAPGEAVRIATGAALPADGLQVVMREDTEREAQRVRLLRRGATRHIRECGEDARRGDTLLTTPTRLAPGALGLLASLGVVRPVVTRLPRIVHVATGDEIVPPDHTPERGQIRDSNSTLVHAFLAARGLPVEQHRAPEDFARTSELLRAHTTTPAPADLLLLSGGASVGEHDFSRRLLVDLGYEILVEQAAVRPGKPLLVARRDHALAFGLPGNPLAHFVALHLFVHAALEAFAGLPSSTPFRNGHLASDIENDGAARETLWPAHATFSGNGYTLEPLRWASSGDFVALGRANALLRVPAGAGRLARGTPVAFVATSSCL